MSPRIYLALFPSPTPPPPGHSVEQSRVLWPKRGGFSLETQKCFFVEPGLNSLISRNKLRVALSFSGLLWGFRKRIYTSSQEYFKTMQKMIPPFAICCGLSRLLWKAWMGRHEERMDLATVYITSTSVPSKSAFESQINHLLWGEAGYLWWEPGCGPSFSISVWSFD